jgi:protein-tyrosine phosphatase
MRVLFVCLGNICRSPTAEGVMRHLLREEGLEGRIVVDSAGTGGWHVGASPDERATAAARERGIVLSGAARAVDGTDFDAWDLIVAMDRDNERDLLYRAPDEEARDKVRLLRSFDAESVARGELEVPDPYYGGERGFEEVLDIVEAGCRALLEELRARVA